MATKRTKINCMIARDYVEHWTKLEALRELIANATDADPHGWAMKIDDEGVCITTRTNPSITECVLMGAGSKSSGGETIGQFGEGLKLAALVLTRGRHGLEIESPEGMITFEIRTARHLDRPTLHAVIDTDTKLESGCVFRFRAKGMVELYNENFLPRDTRELFRAIEKKPGARGCRIYHRGILVKRLEDSSLYDWNLKSVTLNRDRSVPDLWAVKYEIAKLIDARVAGGDAEFAREILRSPKTLEAVSWATKSASAEAASVFANAFRTNYGENAVLSSGHAGRHNALAEARGHNVIPLPGDLADVCHEGGVGRASDVLAPSDSLIPVPTEQRDQYLEELAECRKVLDVLGAQAAIHVFGDDGKTLGLYDKNGVWLNEKLFVPGARFERLRTLCHELGHHRGGGDVTSRFERSLDWISGKLAERMLDAVSA